MSVLAAILLYSFSCSTVLIYGIGLEKTYQDSRSPALFARNLPFLALELALAVPVSRALVEFILSPHGYATLTPMALVFACGSILLVVSALVPGRSNADTGERIFFFGTVFLAVSEGTGFASSLGIAAASLVSFVAITFLLVTIKDRFADAGIHEDWKGAPLALVSLGLLFLALNAADASWRLLGGLR